MPSPNPSAITNPMWNFWLAFKALEPSVRMGGIYANKPGYHNKRSNLPKSDYSVRLAADKTGPNHAAAIDLSLPPAKMKVYSSRLLKSGKDMKDERGNYLREFYGTINGRSVVGWDFQSVTASTSDTTHLWHIHLSFLRKYLNDPKAFRAVMSILRGESVASWRAKEKALQARGKPPGKRVAPAKRATAEAKLAPAPIPESDAKLAAKRVPPAKRAAAKAKFKPVPIPGGNAKAWPKPTTRAQKTQAVAAILQRFVERYYPKAAELRITSAQRDREDKGGTWSHHNGQVYKNSPTAAVDFAQRTGSFPGPAASTKMRDFAKWWFDNFGDLTVEMLHSTPFSTDKGFFVKNQKKSGGFDAHHVNHVHIAMSRHMLVLAENRAARKWPARKP